MGHVCRMRARHCRSLLGAGGSGADGARDPAHLRADPSGGLARAVDWPGAGGPRRCHVRLSPAGSCRRGVSPDRQTISPTTCLATAVNILAKVADIRGAGKGGAVEKIQETIDDIKTDLGQTSAPPDGRASQPVVVSTQPVEGLSGFSWLGPILGPLGTAGLVVAMVMFMLLERRDLRDRLIGLFGHGRLTTTTKAFDEAGTRVSRQLLMQSLVNLSYGVAAGVGLSVLDVPYAWVWAALGAALRFIPYVGPVVGAGAPILVSLAALPGWAGPLWVIALFVILELFTNLVLETVLYAGAAGVSQVALLVSRRLLDLALGSPGVAAGDTADRLSRRARQTRARSGGPRDADG